MSKKEPTFEEALERLEQIAVDIESGKIGLEESINRYEEGMKLLAFCQETLTRAEQRIMQLNPDAATNATPPGDQAGTTEAASPRGTTGPS